MEEQVKETRPVGRPAARSVGRPAARPIVRPGDGDRDEDGFTPEMRAIAEALTNPKGDPYNNARELGFYCEQCG